jgi:hypothetical protein
MCECGCGEMSARKIVSIGNLYLVIEIYPGCEACETGIITTLYLLSKNNIESMGFEIENCDEFKPDKFGYSQIDIPILSADDLMDAIKKHPDGGDEICDDDLEFLQENGVALLQKAIEIRKNKNA